MHSSGALPAAPYTSIDDDTTTLTYMLFCVSPIDISHAFKPDQHIRLLLQASYSNEQSSPPLKCYTNIPNTNSYISSPPPSSPHPSLTTPPNLPRYTSPTAPQGLSTQSKSTGRSCNCTPNRRPLPVSASIKDDP